MCLSSSRNSVPGQGREGTLHRENRLCKVKGQSRYTCSGSGYLSESRGESSWRRPWEGAPLHDWGHIYSRAQEFRCYSAGKRHYSSVSNRECQGDHDILESYSNLHCRVEVDMRIRSEILQPSRGEEVEAWVEAGKVVSLGRNLSNKILETEW